MNEWLEEVDSWREAGDAIVLATVVRVQGSAPRPVGARLAVNHHGRMAGSVSGGCVESAVVMAAQEVLETGVPRMEHYGISDDMAWDVGLSCGGAIDVWIEPLPANAEIDHARELQAKGKSSILLTWLDASGKHAVQQDNTEGQNGITTRDGSQVFMEYFHPTKRLVIFGAVHAAQPLSKFAMELGYEVTVVDARTALATPERFPNVAKIIAAWPEEAYAQLSVDSSTSIAVLSHDPKFDEPAILGALNTEAAYIGTVGSRSTIADRIERLRSAGVTEAQLARLHGPIGLNLGGSTPAEMAVSIVAEMIAAGHGRDGGMLRTSSGRISSAV